MSDAAPNLADLANLLSASDDYRIQRRLIPRSTVTPPDGTPTKTAILIDVETTGLDLQNDEIIELAMISFTYSPDGRIFEIRQTFQRFQEPSRPISAEITRITGITNDMVAGHKIDVAEVAAFAGPAAIVIAHNAGFDRRFAERLSDVFTTKPWACSMSEIDWAAEGFEGTKLHYLAAGAGFFYDRHRAEHDCRAVIELLASCLPVSNRTALAILLDRARQPTWRIWAENSPYDLKDALKARGYRWNGDGNPNPRAWYIDVDDAQREAEISFLRKEIYLRDVELLVHRMDAYNRFSGRQN